MRTCPHCSAINSDDTPNCGVCGAGLSNSASLTLEAAESVAKEETSQRGPVALPRSNSGRIGVAGVLSGVGLMVTGLVLFPLASALWPILMIIPGMVLVLSGLDNLSQTSPRPGFGRSFWSMRGGTMSMRREAEREAEEEEKIESGETD